jgi:hypothetical protein
VSTQSAIVTVIHDQLGQTLEKVFKQGDGLFEKGGADNPFSISTNGTDTLIGQLTDGTDGPPKITLGFALDIAGDSVAALIDALNPAPTSDTSAAPSLPDPGAVLDKVQNALRGKLGFFNQQENAIARLITARNPVNFRKAGSDLFDAIRGTVTGSGRGAIFSLDRVNRLQQLIGNDIGTVLPLATIVKAMQGGREGLRNVEGIPKSIEEGVLDYFFKREGYRTIDGVNVVAPAHLSDLGSPLGTFASDVAAGRGLTVPPQLGGLFSKPTAEHYLRDITRVILESAYDAGRSIGGLNGRYAEVTAGLRSLPTAPKAADATVAKFVSWLRGFGSMAESAAMRAVEVGTQGVSEFQTNPLIAAAAGSFAGTVARKLAQDSFLTVLKAELAHQAPTSKAAGRS